MAFDLAVGDPGRGASGLISLRPYHSMEEM